MPVLKNRAPELFDSSPEELQGFGAQCVHSAHQLAGPHVPFQPEFTEPEAHTCSVLGAQLMNCLDEKWSAKHPAKEKD